MPQKQGRQIPGGCPAPGSAIGGWLLLLLAPTACAPSTPSASISPMKSTPKRRESAVHRAMVHTSIGHSSAMPIVASTGETDGGGKPYICRSCGRLAARHRWKFGARSAFVAPEDEAGVHAAEAKGVGEDVAVVAGARAVRDVVE